MRLHPPSLPPSLPPSPAHLARGKADGRGGRGWSCSPRGLSSIPELLWSIGGTSPGRNGQRQGHTPVLSRHPSNPPFPCLPSSKAARAASSPGICFAGLLRFPFIAFFRPCLFNPNFWLVCSPTSSILFLLPFTFPPPSAPVAAQLSSFPPALTLVVFSWWSCQQPSGI